MLRIASLTVDFVRGGWKTCGMYRRKAARTGRLRAEASVRAAGISREKARTKADPAHHRRSTVNRLYRDAARHHPRNNGQRNRVISIRWLQGNSRVLPQSYPKCVLYGATTVVIRASLHHESIRRARIFRKRAWKHRVFRTFLFELIQT